VFISVLTSDVVEVTPSGKVDKEEIFCTTIVILPNIGIYQNNDVLIKVGTSVCATCICFHSLLKTQLEAQNENAVLFSGPHTAQ